MKCTNKFLSYIISISLSFILLITATGCGKKDDLDLRFDRNTTSSSLSISTSNSLYQYADSFAKDLCIDDGEYAVLSLNSSYAAGLFDINDNSVIYAKNMYEEMTPASITKLLTALVALKYCNLDDKVVFTSACKINESGAQKIGFGEGDSITMEQALNILLLYSANDVALMIAENYEGGKDEFIRLMNEEAASLGATHTHFVNPHGLTEDDHYTTVYDLYLILNELSKNEKFVSIVSQTGYTTSYTKADGSIKTIELKPTNLYLKGDKEVPEGYVIIGGKTGTTEAAGKCLIVLFEDNAGNRYIGCILRSEDHDTLYQDMDTLIKSAN